MQVRAVVLAALVATVIPRSSVSLAPILRFHHLHLRTDNPAAVMNDVARRTGGSRVVLQGLGVGVRLGDQYILLDRGEDSAAAASGDAPAAYASAVAWLEARKVAVVPPAFAATRVAAVAPQGTFDHIAFASPDLTDAIAVLQRAGAEPARRTSESAWFAIDRGITLEITRDSDRPDAFWCPMHPEVRSSTPDKCPVCSMSLVPIPPPTLGAYQVQVTQVPNASGRGLSMLRMQVRHPESLEPVTAFTEIHERFLHLFIVGRDLSYFAHVHPERSGDEFTVPVDLDAGAYVVIADFVPAGGSPQFVQQAIVTPRYSASPFLSHEVKPDLADKIVDGVRVSLTADVMAQKEGTLRFSLRDAVTDAPLTDLEPYLGAAGHLLIVDADLTNAIHGHPEGESPRLGKAAEVVFAPVLPKPGVYKLWVQFQRRGQLLTASFAVVAR